MNFNFFDWLRLGVKQSILLGVSDAVDSLGTPSEDDQIGQQLLGFLSQDAAAGKKRVGGSTRSKKLGRSLKQIQAEAGKAA